MIVGIPKEIKNNEYRVSLTPAGAMELVRRGHTVYIQSGAGVDSATSYWIIDDSGTLKEEYEKTIGNNSEPYTPVYAELKVIDTGKSNEGFAAEYAGVYHVKEVLNISPIKPE